MPIRGDIQTFPLSAIGRMIHAEKKSGILEVTSGAYTTRIYFKEGGIVFINGDLAAEHSLGAMLKADKVVDEETIQKALHISEDSQKRLGVVLMEQGYVTKEILIKTLSNQFKEAISIVLTWKEGTFVYTDGLDGHVEDIRLKVDPIRLVAEAERWKEYRLLIPNDQVVFQIKDRSMSSNSYTGEGLHHVMLLLDGQRDVAQIINETGLTRIAVYRALTSLFVKGTIERKKGTGEQKTPQRVSQPMIIQFFLSLLDEIIADLSMELGDKKAKSILDRSMRMSPYHDIFLNGISLGDTTETTIKTISENIRQQTEPVTAREIANGFKGVVTYILKEEYRLLGLKAQQSTIKRIADATENMPTEQRTIADSFIPFLAKVFSAGAQPKSTEDIFNVTNTDGDTMNGGNSIPHPHLQNISGGVIVVFYCRIVQFLMADLEKAIGTKSRELIDGILGRSSYYEEFISQYDLQEDAAENVQRIRKHIAEKGYRLSKMSFIRGFQEILKELLIEQKRLLGKKSTRTSLMNINKVAAHMQQDELQPLIEYLNSTLQRAID